MKKSKKNLSIVFLAIFLFSLFGLAGCKDAKTEEALAAAQKDLMRVKTELAKITSERNDLKLELTAAIEARDKLQAMVGETADIDDQLVVLTKERDTAIAKATEAQGMVEKLKSQLAEQIKKVTGLEGQNKKLQEMIDELKKKLGSDLKLPSIPEL